MDAKQSRLTRRAVLAGAAAASVHFWIPKPVTGYSSAELRAMTVNEKVVPGISKWDLETPALCLDLDKMEKNVAAMQAALKKYGLPSRPHAKTHKCAAIAKYQLSTGSIGICCAKLGEAEAFAASGIDKILMTTSNLAPTKIKRAMQLRKSNRYFIQAVDEERNARDLSAAAKAAGVVADVVIDVAVGTRSGIPPGEGAVKLGQLIDTLPNLKLRGILSYDGGVQHAKGFQSRKERALKAIAPNVETFDLMKKAGLNMEIFSGGGTGTYNIMHLVPGFTDLQVGSYLFMDMQYLAIGSESGDEVYTDFAPSLTVLTTVMNNRFPGRLTTDAGAKALTLNTPNAGVIGEPGMDYSASSDEFGAIRFTAPPTKDYRIGDKLEVIVPHCDPVVNEYDQVYGTRKDRVDVVWKITARGKSQ
ncbi:MAG TPA: alanine racemase [Vicinamibacterales bacterium]|jgi:D-serine deaminase-like pyridoxal phosphate-dependent protein